MHQTFFIFIFCKIKIYINLKKSKSSHTLNISSIHCFCLLVCCLVLFLTVFGDFGGLRNTGIIFQTQRLSPSFTYSLWVDYILGRANCRAAVAGGALVIFFRISVTPVYGWASDHMLYGMAMVWVRPILCRVSSPLSFPAFQSTSTATIQLRQKPKQISVYFSPCILLSKLVR